MTRRRIPGEFFIGLNWALFALGATELTLILSGPVYFLLIALVSSCIFAISLVYVYPRRRSPNQSILFSSGLLIILQCLYTYLVLLDWSTEMFVLHFVAAGIFLAVAFAAKALIINISNGAG